MDLLGTRAVSKEYSVPEETLRYWRARGEGPEWFRLGKRRVVYDRADVERWVNEQRAATVGRNGAA